MDGKLAAAGSLKGPPGRSRLKPGIANQARLPKLTLRIAKPFRVGARMAHTENPREESFALGNCEVTTRRRYRLTMRQSMAAAISIFLALTALSYAQVRPNGPGGQFAATLGQAFAGPVGQDTASTMEKCEFCRNCPSVGV